MKRILHTILACLLLVVLIPARAEAATVAEGTCGDNLTWTLDDGGTLTISGAGAMADFNSANEASWYDYQEQITSVVIEAGVTHVGNYAFSGWYQKIQSIFLGEDLESIGDWAFYSCGGLTEPVIIPDNVKSIGTCAFMNCYALTGLTLGEGLERIGDSGFAFCWEIAGKLTLPVNLEEIGHGAFQGCKKLTQIEWNDNLRVLDCQAFCECEGLTGDILLPDSITIIDSNPFRECPYITSVVFGKNLAELGDSTNALSTLFYGCEVLSEITFTGNNVPTIYGNGFADMTALKTVWVPAGSLDAYTTALSGKLPSGAVIQPIGAPETPAPSPTDLDWFFDRIKEPGNTMWATATYYRIMESIKN